MINKSLAPIVLFVYNRPDTTQATLQALALNKLAIESRLIIFADGPKVTTSNEEKEAILQVRAVIRNWTDHFGEVVIKEREQNLGLAKSIITGVSEVIKVYGKVIVLEDDLITAPGFLAFMNEGLTKYAAVDKVFGLTGFKAPSRRPRLHNTFFLPVMSSWSWGTWANRWESVSFDGPTLLKEIEARGEGKDMNINGYDFYHMLKSQVAGEINSWAIRFYTSMFLQCKWFLYPSYSLVQNIGF
ncbi:MAG: hypothetical protein AAFU67_12260, partial [Bacteroidota bacterium]